MGKNIVLCADGTGNKGGYTPDSNVYKMYLAVDIHHPKNPQMTYYDNGVGTSQNKILRALGGALGLGFSANVMDLYKYLARKYDPGESDSDVQTQADKVFLFGFSRGAATIRAFSGFVHTCGLIDGRELSNDDLTKRVKEQFNNYIKWRRDPNPPEPVAVKGVSHGVIDIEFLGVWDTVSALGFPERTDITSVGLKLLSWAFTGLDYLTDRIPSFEHRFYNYELTENVKYAYQALSLDDARTAFWPWIWDENGREQHTVEQVWFAGMHSNVGGGYERSGMAKVALEWMMERCSRHGLMLREDKMNEVSAEAHVDGRIYDSRDGLAMYYRYHPRELEKLCYQEKKCCQKKLCDTQRSFAVTATELASDPTIKPSCNKLLGEIKIHDSVIRRMKNRTANYAPSQLPGKFEISQTKLKADGVIVEPAKDKCWSFQKTAVNKVILFRKWLYGIMLEATLLIIALALYLWSGSSESDVQVKSEGFMEHIADILNYILPDIFGVLIKLVVIDYPVVFWVTIVIFIAYFKIRGIAQHKTIVIAERLRRIVMQSIKQK